MKNILTIIIFAGSIGSSFAQERGFKISYQQFDAETPKSNISNNWSWIGLAYDKKVSDVYRFSAGLNFNTSHIFANNSSQLYNIHPRGKTIIEKVGLSYTNYLVVKTYEESVSWAITNHVGISSTRLFGTQSIYDSLGNFVEYNDVYSSPALMLRLDLGLALRAKLTGNIFIEVRPACQFIAFNTNIYRANSTRFLIEASAIFRLRKRATQ